MLVPSFGACLSKDRPEGLAGMYVSFVYRHLAASEILMSHTLALSPAGRLCG
ncbi:hypothetical protein ES703_40835 [subsurface metagenome]